MNDADLEWMKEQFGESVVDPDWRRASYGLLEAFVDDATNEDGTVETDSTVESFQEHLGDLNDGAFAFLLLHSGFIPDHYGADSSQETLHTKLTEAVACEWGRRIGMESGLQKEKSSKEDVTYRCDGKVIVSDAKSFRLGRSQSAPNVKDAIKQGDYKKWLSAYDEDERLGGVITFPSQHDWKKGSDAYSYVSNPLDPIMLIFYEHMAYTVCHAQEVKDNGGIAGILADYSNVFSSASRQRAHYWDAMLPHISALAAADDLAGFTAKVQPIIMDAVAWAEQRIEDRIKAIHDAAKIEVAAMAESDLRASLVNTITHSRAERLHRYLTNIRKFRK